MRPQDLIPTFLRQLERICKEDYTKALGHLEREVAYQISGTGIDDDHPWWQSEECAWFLNEVLWDALDSWAPEGCYFGAIEGDGSDFGFWSLNTNIQRINSGKVMVYAFPGGYPMYYLTQDDSVLCPQCVEENQDECSDSSDPKWYVESHGINYENNSMHCDECSKQIECA